MRTYQTLSLIGCIIGIFLVVGLMLLLGGVKSVSDTLLNMSRPTESERQEHIATYAWVSPAIAGLFFAFLIYIIILVVTFAVKRRTKAVGITILLLGILTMAVTNLWGIIPFALLLPAGIVALRYKPRKKGPQMKTVSKQTSDPDSNLVSGSKNLGNNMPNTINNPSEPDSTRNESGDTSQLNILPMATENLIDTPEDEQEEYDDEEDEDEERN